jgi:WD40 repeat protein
MAMLKLSKDQSFLVAYVDIDTLESFYVYNTINKEKIWEGKLDLAIPSIREDPFKLLHISEDNLCLFARSKNKKKISKYSLYDGSMIYETQQLHTNYIYAFLLTKDGKKLITASKDKKVKVWDWIK